MKAHLGSGFNELFDGSLEGAGFEFRGDEVSDASLGERRNGD